MVKYVDSGEGVGSLDKKKNKRLGFKVDRRANFEKMLRKKLGKDGKNAASSSTAPARAKSVVFDEAALKEYVTSLHKNKNERRVKAFVDMKRKVKKDSAKVRREQREEARRAYNQYAKVPILPNYTFRLPTVGAEDPAALLDEELEDEDPDRLTGSSDEDEDVESDPLDQVLQPLLAQRSKHQRTTLLEHTTHHMPSAMMGGGGDGGSGGVDNEEEDEKEKEEISAGGRGRGNQKKKDRKKKQQGNDDDNDTAAAERKKKNKVKQDSKSGSTSTLEAFYAAKERDEAAGPAVTVEVRPLFAPAPPPASASSSSAKMQKGKSAPLVTSTLPSADFSDLPAVVEEELRRLRQETKGPTRTKAKIHTLKELEKIRKIRKHSRKGHGKKSTSGKRKNRK